MYAWRAETYQTCIMGNCIGAEGFPSKKKLTLKSLHEGEEEFGVLETKRRTSSGSYEVLKFSNSGKAQVKTDSKLKSGEVYCFIPEQVAHCSNLPSRGAAGNRYRGRRVKIVVTKQQLEQLVRRMKELQRSRIAAIQSLRTRRRKWRPSLATIPEL